MMVKELPKAFGHPAEDGEKMAVFLLNLDMFE